MAKPYGLASQKLCYIQMLLDNNKNGEQDQKYSQEWLVNTVQGDCWVPRGSVVKCLTRNPGVLGSSLTGSSGYFRGRVLGQDTSEPSLVLVKTRKA